MFSLGHIISLIVLDVTGIGLNACFLYRIKKRSSPPNSIDLLQTIKTTVALAALVLCLGIELIPCTGAAVRACAVAKDIINDATFHSTCWIFLCVAIVRLKVCTCRGRASVLVTTEYVVRLLVFSMTPVAIASVSSLFLALFDSSSSELIHEHSTVMSYAASMDGPVGIGIQILHLLLINILPICIGCFSYMRVIKIVNDTSQTTEEFVSNRKVSLAKVITRSVATLLGVTVTAWLVYVSLEVASVFCQIEPIVVIYWKIIVLNAQPFGEGLIQSHKVQPNEQKTSDEPNGVTSQNFCTTASAGYPDKNCDKFISESTSEISQTFLTEMNKTEHFRNEKQYPRKSITRATAEIHFPNGPLVSLEVKNSSQILNVQKERKLSKRNIKNALHNIDYDTANGHTLGNSNRREFGNVRLSSTDSNINDEVLENYRVLYERRSSKMFPQQKLSYHEISGFADPVKVCPSGRNVLKCSAKMRWKKLLTKSGKVLPKFNIESTGIPETEAPDTEIDNGRSSKSELYNMTTLENTTNPNLLSSEDDKNRSLSPSLKHWKNIVRTTITVRRLSKWQERRRKEMGNKTELCPPYRPLARAKPDALECPSSGIHDQFLSAESLIKDGNHTREGIVKGDSNLCQRTPSLHIDENGSKLIPPRKSKRSISCVSRPFVQGHMLVETAANKPTKTRNASVSFEPGVGMKLSPSTSNSCSSYQTGPAGQAGQAGASGVRIKNKYSRHSKDEYTFDIEKSHKKERIEKLIDMKKYF